MIRKILTTFALVTLILLAGGVTVHAYQIDSSYRPINSPYNLDYTKESASTNIIIILQILAGALLYFAAPVATMFIVTAAFSMTIGGSESEQIEQAKKHLIWSVLGLLLIIMSYSLVRIIITILVKSAESSDPIETTASLLLS